MTTSTPPTKIALLNPSTDAGAELVLGALFAAGLDADWLRAELGRLPRLGHELRIEPVCRTGITGVATELVVRAPDPEPTWHETLALLEASALPDPVRELAVRVLALLHDDAIGAPDEITERGPQPGSRTAETIVGIVGVCLGLFALGVDRLFATPLIRNAGSDPASHPRAAAIADWAALPFADAPAGGDPRSSPPLSPSGAALLAALADFSPPAFTPEHVGYGFAPGARSWPDGVRLWLGEASGLRPPASAMLTRPLNRTAGHHAAARFGFESPPVAGAPLSLDALPPRYRQGATVSAAPMGAADLVYDAEGAVAWDAVWHGFCDLALAGGPSHRGTMLEEPDLALVHAEPARQAVVLDQLAEGLLQLTGWPVLRAMRPGWIGLGCPDEAAAAWLERAIVAENVAARRHGRVLFLPAAPFFRLDQEIRNVVTAVAKTHHYWQELADERTSARLSAPERDAT